MKKQHHRTSVHSPEFALLGFLYEQSNHGYNLHRKLVTELGQVWHVSQSQTYNILKRLESQGYISSTTQGQEKLPPRQILQITDDGHRRFEEWLRTPSGSTVHATRLEFITRLYFAQKLFPTMMPTIIDAQYKEINTALSQLEADLPTVPPEQTFNRISLELRILQLRSVCDWLIGCRKTFKKWGKTRIA
jgi:DNA-binding PadR family transcriptional regulator